MLITLYVILGVMLYILLGKVYVNVSYNRDDRHPGYPFIHRCKYLQWGEGYLNQGMLDAVRGIFIFILIADIATIIFLLIKILPEKLADFVTDPSKYSFRIKFEKRGE